MGHERTNFGRQNNNFKSLAISKIVHLAVITKVPNAVIEELRILAGKKCPKIKIQRL